MADLISRAAALEALGECPYNWNDWPEEIQAVYDWESHKEAIENIPAVDAVPVEWMRDKMRGYASALKSTELKALVTVMQMWQKEQEAKE